MWNDITDCLDSVLLAEELSSSAVSSSVRKDVLRNFTKFAGKHLCLQLY